MKNSASVRRLEMAVRELTEPKSEIARPAASASAHLDEVERVLGKPVEEMTMTDLAKLLRDHPKGLEIWEQVKTVARNDLEGGAVAGLAFESMSQSAWERASFLAMRQRLLDAWRPRHGGEVALVDQMTQYELLRQKWLVVLAMFSREPLATLQNPERADQPRPMSAAQRTQEALQVVERLQRLFHTAIRTLIGLRGGRTNLFVGKAAQINVTPGPQVNVQTAASNEDINHVDTAAE